MVLVFGGSSELDADLSASTPLAALVAAYPNSCVSGCSTSGEILGDTLSDNTLTVLVVRFETTTVSLAVQPVSGPSDCFYAGRRLASELMTSAVFGHDTGGDVHRAIFVLSEGLGVSGTLLVDGLAWVAGPSVAISGGLAGDGARFERTWSSSTVELVPATSLGSGSAGQICGLGSARVAGGKFSGQSVK